MAKFISLEGIETTGKSSLTEALSDTFKQLGYVVQTAHDPGTTERAEQIRALVFQKTREGANFHEIAALYMEARASLATEIIIPFMSRHQNNKRALFICDRFLDSTRVYLGFSNQITMAQIFQLEKQYLSGLLPDITILCYFSEPLFESSWNKRRELVLQKRAKNNNISIWHQNSLREQRSLQENYLTAPQIATEHGEKRIFELLDVCRPFDKVLEDAKSKLLAHLETPNTVTGSFDTV